MASVLTAENCVICRKEFGAELCNRAVCVNEGRSRLLECAAQHNDSELSKYLLSDPVVVNVHEGCRRHYLYIGNEHLKRNATADEYDINTGKTKYMRSSVGTFNFKNHCFFVWQNCHSRQCE